MRSHSYSHFNSALALILLLTASPFAAKAPDSNVNAAVAAKAPDTVAASIFAGGSFWCLEAAFESLAGVDSAVSGYTGGQGSNPNFESVASGNTGFVEAVKVYYNPKRIGYPGLLDAFWKNIDPTRADGQFSDPGRQYRTVLYYRDEAEKKAATASLKRLEKSKRFSKPLVTEIAPAAEFFPAETEHQNYYRKNAGRYKAYMDFSGREAFFKKVWGPKPAK